jgi:hypothetical protein
MATRIHTPVCLTLLVVLLAAAVGVAAAAVTDGYQVRRVDAGLLACARGMLSQPFAALPASGRVGSATCDMELLTATGQPLTPGTGPAIPASGSWLASHAGQPVTVPGTGSRTSWRVVLAAVHYQPQRILYVYGPDNVRYLIGSRRPGGVLVVMSGLADENVLAARYAGAVVLLVLLTAGVLAAKRRPPVLRLTDE